MFTNNYDTIVNPLNSLEEKEEKFDYQSFYRAYVISVEDPKQMGRVKIRIPSLHGVRNDTGIAFQEDNGLPWAYPGIFAAGANQSGSIILPEVGSIVWVTFEYDSDNAKRNFIYFGGVLTLKSRTLEKTLAPQRNVNFGEDYVLDTDDFPVELLTNKAIKMIYKSLKGAKIFIDDSDGKEQIHLFDATGQEISLGNDTNVGGYVEGRTPSDKTKLTSRLLIKHDDNSYIKVSEGVVDIEAPRVIINGTDVNTDISNESILGVIFPVGKVEIFMDTDDHSSYLGYTWEKKEELVLSTGGHASLWQRIS